jgi:hypothetical protein
MCSEIFLEGARPAQKMEVKTLTHFYETKRVNCRGKTD